MSPLYNTKQILDEVFVLSDTEGGGMQQLPIYDYYGYHKN